MCGGEARRPRARAVGATATVWQRREVRADRHPPLGRHLLVVEIAGIPDAAVGVEVLVQEVPAAAAAAIIIPAPAAVVVVIVVVVAIVILLHHVVRISQEAIEAK